MRILGRLQRWPSTRIPRFMKQASHIQRRSLVVEQMESRALLSAVQDYLYIGDQGDGSTPLDDSVKQFDANTGAFIGSFVAPNSGGLNGPRGMVFRNPGALLVVNQNVNLDSAGEVLHYNGKTGAFLNSTISADNPDAPYAPRGMVLSKNTLFVADVEKADAPSGRIARYDLNSGKFLSDMTPSADFTGQFNPRGVVFGPDGKLYVSVFETTNPLAGYVLRFDTSSGTSVVIAANDGDGIDEPGEIKDLHRPEGLVFGPNGQLYVTSFRADPTDNDKILVLDVMNGLQTDKIDLDVAGQPRAFAQAIEFGPNGKLFVPITGNGPDTGSVRAYDVAAKSYTVFVPSAANGGPLVAPWYLTFGQTNPATLSYNTKPGSESSQGTKKVAAAIAIPAADPGQPKTVSHDRHSTWLDNHDGHTPVSRAKVLIDANGSPRGEGWRISTRATSERNIASATDCVFEIGGEA